jgi:hypothetical protein
MKGCISCSYFFLLNAAKYVLFDTGVRNAATEVLGFAEFPSEYWENFSSSGSGYPFSA